ncbi:PKD domain-containing protein [Microbacterium sp. TNHR37B]|uniref:PKD domain-containing protein n=1 Tax=Microbacterium sp. TNHR37B TaxID=1775956 RepID=UPI000833CBCB|nr:PKD domain-containing protein [Microbacterium sp. TNHR37B]
MGTALSRALSRALPAATPPGDGAERASIARVRTTRGVVAVTVAALAATLAIAGPVSPASAAAGPDTAPPEQRNSATVTADPLPTVQIDSGVVWTQAIAGNTVFAGGSFSAARPAGAAPGERTFPRHNLLAYDIRTGEATSFAPKIEGTVKSLAVSPDGKTLYVGGAFKKVNDQDRFYLAAFDVATGELTNFKAAMGGGYVNAIAVTDRTVYVGGLFGAAKGVGRQNLAAVTTKGELLSWAPTADRQIDAMTLTPEGDKVIIGGRFRLVNGAVQPGLAALDAVTGTKVRWAAQDTIQNAKSAVETHLDKGGIWNLTTDGKAVYGTGWTLFGKVVGNLEGAFSANPSTGALNWVADCHGDHYGVYSDGTNVYTANHAHDCSTVGGFPEGGKTNQRHATVYTTATKGKLGPALKPDYYQTWEGTNAPAFVDWSPEWVTGTATGMGQATWSVTGNGEYVVYGGEFPFVNKKRSQGIARFAVNPPGGPKEGPQKSGTDWAPTASSAGGSGMVRVTVPLNWDRDDLSLTYDLYVDGIDAPIGSATVDSPFWERTKTVTVIGSGLTPGATYTARIVARDGDGNSATSATTTATAGVKAASVYADQVRADGASLLWRLGTTGSAANGGNGGTDWVGSNDAVFGSGVGSKTTDGAIANDDKTSATVNGTASAWARAKTATPLGGAFATEIWVKTNTTKGGWLSGYRTPASGTVELSDRMVYMRNDGKLTFGLRTGVYTTVSTTKAYNDNKWHHVVAQLSPTGGMELYVDGTRVASNSAITSARAYTGFWQVGGDTITSGWPTRPSSSFLSGQIDEFAVYPQALTAAQIKTHHAIGTGAKAPSAVVTTSGKDLAWAFDGSGSKATTGDIAGYAWNFGDGTTGTGRTASHEYAKPGTYTVALTVTDAGGLSQTTRATVTATAPRIAPTAAFSSKARDLAVSFDGGASSAESGTSVAAYRWDFGDGTSGTGSAPTHEYTEAGTYAVSLVVTDARGIDSETVTHDVTVSAPEAGLIARDTFERSVSSGWGEATSGATWVTPAGFAVADGVGTIEVGRSQTKTAVLTGAVARDVDARAVFGTEAVSDGGGVHLNLAVRASDSGAYRLKLRIASTGVVTASTAKLLGSTETLLTSRAVPDYVHTAGGRLHTRLQAVSEGGTTTLRAKVWPVGTEEPDAWLIVSTDAEAELQDAGSLRISAYLTGTSTNGPARITVDDIEAQQPAL